MRGRLCPFVIWCRWRTHVVEAKFNAPARATRKQTHDTQGPADCKQRCAFHKPARDHRERGEVHAVQRIRLSQRRGLKAELPILFLSK